MVGWLVGWLVGRLVGWLVGCVLFFLVWFSVWSSRVDRNLKLFGWERSKERDKTTFGHNQFRHFLVPSVSFVFFRIFKHENKLFEFQWIVLDAGA